MPQNLRPKLATTVGGVLLGVGVLSLIFGFIGTVRDFQLLPDPNVFLPLGVPVGVFTITFAFVTIVLGASIIARDRRPSSEPSRRGHPFGVALLLFGVIGWYAAFALAADKVLLALEPSAELGCNVSLLVQCGANLESWQGSVLGFPNPLIGIAGWAAVVTVGCLVLSGIRLAPWFWVTFTVGGAGALAFVAWLISQSIFVLGTLCPWCMVTWAVTIPLFWAVTLRGAKDGHFGVAIRRTIGPAYSWVPLISVVSYLVVAVIAQLRLDVLSYL
jgi:uncharacterized membrane protein